MYGLYDTKSNCWLGNKEGPKLYENRDLAAISARVLDVQLQLPAGTIRAVEYTDKEVEFKDEVDTVMTTEEALTKLEEGLVL